MDTEISTLSNLINIIMDGYAISQVMDYEQQTLSTSSLYIIPS